MAILDDLTAQINDAQKRRDAERRDALRLIRDAIQKEIKDSSTGQVDELAILRREQQVRRARPAIAACEWIEKHAARHHLLGLVRTTPEQP